LIEVGLNARSIVRANLFHLFFDLGVLLCFARFEVFELLALG